MAQVICELDFLQIVTTGLPKVAVLVRKKDKVLKSYMSRGMEEDLAIGNANLNSYQYLGHR